jgi:peptide-methionine (S)-S-oxide reductase
MANNTKIALGGGCHWCTEAVFQALKGVLNVEQGFVASEGEYTAFSEAVIVHFNPDVITLKTLIEIHLRTHKSTSNHSMRTKYRSAIYAFSDSQGIEAETILNVFQLEFDNKLITKVYSFLKFKPSREAIQNYYLKNPKKPFCERFINPKLKLLRDTFSHHINTEYISNNITQKTT